MPDAAGAAKRASARAVVALVSDGMIVGLGTGSTMALVLDELAAAGRRITGVPTSDRTADQARRLGIALGDLARIDRLDLAIDGADEVVRGSLDLIKGLGGALLREKIIVQAASRFVVVADEGKIVGRLGSKAPLPIEVVPFGHEATARHLAALGIEPVLRMAADAPYRTDNGNLIYDCRGVDRSDNVAALEDAMLRIAGVVETGLFLGRAERAIIGRADGGSTELLPG